LSNFINLGEKGGRSGGMKRDNWHCASQTLVLTHCALALSIRI